MIKINTLLSEATELYPNSDDFVVLNKHALTDFARRVAVESAYVASTTGLQGLFLYDAILKHLEIAE
jgi:hypothetical protein